jgi:hypothetical protein
VPAPPISELSPPFILRGTLDTLPTEEEPVPTAHERPRVPGLVLLWSAGAPICRYFDARAPLVLGRTGSPAFADPRLPRKHAEITW